MSRRVAELPLAAELNQHVGNLRIAVSELRGLRAATFRDISHNRVDARVISCRERFRRELFEVENTLANYSNHLDNESRPDRRMADIQKERDTARKIKLAIEKLRRADRDEDWVLYGMSFSLDVELDQLQELTDKLPSHLHEKMANFNKEVRSQALGLINCVWIFTILAAALFGAFVQLFYRWIFRPLKILVAGSRRVAGGDFDYRISLATDDEIAELAAAMNDMTARFQDVRDDLDRQVQERTRQVVRAEQMASVGFLAAGVAHEINNPLASIAMCAESLEGRLVGQGGQVHFSADESSAKNAHSPKNGPVPNLDQEQEVIARYLRMIQSEAFRCKDITEKLLDFSRIGPVKRQRTDLGELVQGVVEMVGHIGKYQRKQIVFERGRPAAANVCAAEIKQVVLNLLTNALDSLDDNGTVRVEASAAGDFAEIVVRDDGCGMAPEVLKHIFEPFFTRRRGGQGTGLGLSISYRIVSDHGGTIEGRSAGAGRGATFVVRLPLADVKRIAA
ncbi:MAG: HAMP domain-containing histidine kinase [Pirellulales bacterium]|nr:HAMP domain-containing histidine kinase [Pirellulales bacterium]